MLPDLRVAVDSNIHVTYQRFMEAFESRGQTPCPASGIIGNELRMKREEK
jgi:hypothetical protein